MTDTIAPTRQGRIILTRGIPASGKSTWAKEWVAEDPENRIRLNRDDLRRMFTGGGPYRFDFDNEGAITAIQHATARRALKAGKDVVVDDTNLRARHVRKWLEVGPIEFRDFPIAVDEAIKRDSKREHPVGEKVIRDFYNRYVRGTGGVLPAPPERLPERDRPVFERYVPDTFARRAYIFDIDGTLAHLDPENPREWHDYGRVGEDIIDLNVLRMVHYAWDHATIILVSGRRDDCRDETEQWLHDNGVPFDHLFMRKAGDERNDDIVKYELFDEHIRRRYNVLGVFDDRNRVVAMWRAIGLKCYQVADGDF